MHDHVRPDGPVIRPDRVAQMLDIPRAKVYELLAARALPSFKIGRVRLVLVKDVEDYIQRLSQTAAAVADEPRVSA